MLQQVSSQGAVFSKRDMVLFHDTKLCFFSDSSVKDLIQREQHLWNPVWQITTFIHSQLPQSLLMPQRTSVGLVFLALRRAILWLVRPRGQFLLSLVSHIFHNFFIVVLCINHVLHQPLLKLLMGFSQP